MQLELQQATKSINNGTQDEKVLLDHVDFQVETGQFVTILGGNGAGKSTLFNTISGNLPLSSGKVLIKGQDVSGYSEEKRAQFLARVFQDPKLGTAPRMTVAENLLLAQFRGKKRPLRLRRLASQKEQFYAMCQEVGNGLEAHLDTPTGNLSGGQRQALSLLMATLTTPDVLLLDEHTAALDPKTSKSLMALTEKKVREQQLTCLMITHRMEDALQYGNRLIVLEKGKIVRDFDEESKKQLTLLDLLSFFESSY